MFLKFLCNRYERYYKSSKVHLVIDAIFVILILILIGTNVYLFNKDFPVKVQPVSINRAPKVIGEKVEVPISQKPKTVNTNLILKSKVVYYTDEGEQLGIGPWPPQVNETTSVRIVSEISTDLHPVKKIQFKAKLPPEIKWTGNVAVNSGQAPVYDKEDNLIIWSFDNLSPGKKALVSFEIEFTPDKNDLDRKIKLVEDIKVLSIDVITGQVVVASNSDLYSLKVKHSYE